MRHRLPSTLAAAGLVSSLLAACREDARTAAPPPSAAQGSAARTASAASDPAARPTAPPAPGTVVDSLIPIPELLRRFRMGLGPAPAGLAHGAPSREALVRRFVHAVETRDTAVIRDLLLSRREFAYLYYPSSPLARRPYEEPPALLWFQLSEGSNKGAGRLLQRAGGRPLNVLSHHCEPGPIVQGDNRLWQRCTVRRVRPPRDTVDARLFGSIIERGGRFKFVSYANDL